MNIGFGIGIGMLWRGAAGPQPLIPNGEFNSPPDDWTAQDGNLVIEHVAGQMQTTKNGASNYAWIAFATEAAVEYTITCDVDLSTNATGASLQLRNATPGGAYIGDSATKTTDGQISYTFTALGTTTVVRAIAQGTGAVVLWDNFFVDVA